VSRYPFYQRRAAGRCCRRFSSVIFGVLMLNDHLTTRMLVGGRPLRWPGVLIVMLARATGIVDNRYLNRYNPAPFFTFLRSGQLNGRARKKKPNPPSVLQRSGRWAQAVAEPARCCAPSVTRDADFKKRPGDRRGVDVEQSHALQPCISTSWQKAARCVNRQVQAARALPSAPITVSDGISNGARPACRYSPRLAGSDRGFN